MDMNAIMKWFKKKKQGHAEYKQASPPQQLQDLFTVKFDKVENLEFDTTVENSENVITRVKRLNYLEHGIFTHCSVSFIDNNPSNLVFSRTFFGEEDKELIIDFVEQLYALFGQDEEGNKQMSEDDKTDFRNNNPKRGTDTYKWVINTYKWQNAGIELFLATYLLMFFINEYKKLENPKK